jgi:hypothetical protein
MSATKSDAPARLSRSTSREPTRPTPTTDTERPARSREPNKRSQHARIAASTPSAVTGLGSPLPPSDSGRPATCSVPSRITIMSWLLVPTSSAVMYAPSRTFTVSAKSSRMFRR